MEQDKLYRNDPCPCGSGKKYKRCCAIQEESDTTGSFFGLAMVVTLVAMVVATGALALAFFSAEPDQAPKGERIWSEEHGHWHNENGGEPGEAGNRVWSEEHGHFHGGGGGDSGPRPGKVWNEQHGHYHNADAIDRHTITGSNSEDHREVQADLARRAIEASKLQAESAGSSSAP
jgi:hypothetical protein